MDTKIGDSKLRAFYIPEINIVGFQDSLFSIGYWSEFAERYEVLLSEARHVIGWDIVSTFPMEMREGLMAFTQFLE